MMKKIKAFTLLELVIVVMIIGILSAALLPVLTNQVLKARIARTKNDIRVLETAISRFKIDTGEYPPSGSDITDNVATGNGYLSRFLRHEPQAMDVDVGVHEDDDIYEFIMRIQEYWDGPYIEVPREQLDFEGYPDQTEGIATSLDETARSTGRGEPAGSDPNNQQILDAFREPFRYINHNDYEEYMGTERDPDDPFAQTETYYNAQTFQIVSGGQDLISLPAPEIGLDKDDITNF